MSTALVSKTHLATTKISQSHTVLRDFIDGTEPSKHAQIIDVEIEPEAEIKATDDGDQEETKGNF